MSDSVLQPNLGMEIILKKCCPKDCLSSFPEELRLRTIAQMRSWTTREKSIFLMGKLAASLALGELPDHSKNGNANRVSYYTFDKNHVICRTAFQVVYDITDVHLRGIKRQLSLAEIDLQKLDECQAKKSRIEQQQQEIDPEAELRIVRDAIRRKCCIDDCLSKIPELLLTKTKTDMLQLSPREKHMFLVGKLSSCLSIVGTKHDSPTAGNSCYNYDKDYPLCKPAFQLIYGVSEKTLRRLRDRLFDNIIEYESKTVIELQDEPSDFKVSSFEQELLTIQEVKNVQREHYRGCCQKACMSQIPEELLAQMRLQVKHLTSNDRHAFLLGKISSSISIVRLSIVPNETQARASYSFDRNHPLCSTAFNCVFSGCKDQCQRLRNHLLSHGISLAAHGLAGKPSNSKGKKCLRKPRSEKSSEMVEAQECDDNYAQEANASSLEISEAFRNFLQ